MARMEIQGTDLYYEDAGGTGQPVVFLHGFLFDARQFAAQADALAGQYRCIGVDFPGQGRSGPSTVGYGTDALTDLIVAFLERLDLGPVHLVGLSMGGFTAMRIAVRRPDLVASLVLVNSSASAHARSAYPKQLALAGLGRVAGLGLPPVLQGIEEEMFGRSFRDDDGREQERDVWRQRWADADRAALVSTMLGFMRRSDYRGELGAISAPTLIVAGSQDVSLPAQQSIEMYDRVPGAELVVLRHVGHSAPVEDPEGFTRALQQFLATSSRPRPVGGHG